MKKKLFALTTLLLSGIALASCNSSNSSYKLKSCENKLDKGKEVDSISFSLANYNEKVKINISKNDKFNDVIDKFLKAEFRTLGRKKNEVEDFEPYYVRTKNISSNNSEEYEKYETQIEADTIVYKPAFFVGNYIKNESSIKKSGEKNNKETIYNGIGTYINNVEGNYIFASTNINPGINLLKENEAVYINKSFNSLSEKMDYLHNAFVNHRSLYYSMDLFLEHPANGRSLNIGTTAFSDPNDVTYTFPNLNNVDERFIPYYNAKESFELTSNYLIIKQRYNTGYIDNLVFEYEQSGNEEVFTKLKDEKEIKRVNDEYYELEIWIDYNSKLLNRGSYYINTIGYSYLNYSRKSKNYVANYESYNLNLTSQDILAAKTSFVDKCKKNSIEIEVNKTN